MIFLCPQPICMEHITNILSGEKKTFLFLSCAVWGHILHSCSAYIHHISYEMGNQCHGREWQLIFVFINMTYETLEWFHFLLYPFGDTFISINHMCVISWGIQQQTKQLNIFFSFLVQQVDPQVNWQMSNGACCLATIAWTTILAPYLVVSTTHLEIVFFLKKHFVFKFKCHWVLVLKL